MLNRVIQGLDTLDIALIDFVLPTRPMRLVNAEKAPHQAHRAFHQIEIGNAHQAALMDEFETQLLMHQGE